MSVLKAVDLAYARYRAPDLAKMQAFLCNFGMVPAEGPERSKAERLYMRGHGTAPFLHVTELGEPGFVAFGLWASGLRELERLAKAENAAIEPLDAPGQGYLIRLTDPDGFGVEVIAGQTPVQPLAVPNSAPWNHAGAYPRPNPRRVAKGASHVLRMGHIVLGVSDFRDSERWYKDRFGLLTSDEIHASPGLGVGAFMRCDRGSEPSDHHAVFLLQHPGGPGYMHAAFEVHDLDDLMAGHTHLHATAATPQWGVGRHVLGSQVFDYWRDPWGHEIEHWTDGDRFDSSVAPGVASLEELTGVQWGSVFPGPAPQGH